MLKTARTLRPEDWHSAAGLSAAVADRRGISATQGRVVSLGTMRYNHAAHPDARGVAFCIANRLWPRAGCRGR